MPPNLLDSVESVTYHASLSDHKYVIMLIDLPNIVKPPDLPISESPYWKLNTSILKDDDFLENFSVMYSKLKLKIPEYPDIAC